MADVQATSAGERVALQLEQMVLRRVEEDRLVLPPMPGVAVRCLDLIQKADFSAPKVTALLETDPIMAARILRTANAKAAQEPVNNLAAAIGRLDANDLRTALTEASVGAVGESRDKQIAEAVASLWQHSVAVALLAREVGTLLAIADPEEAYLAGLLHDVGKPVLAILLLDVERQLAVRPGASWLGSDDWLGVLQRLHRKIGVALAKRWTLPAVAAKVIEESATYDEGEARSVANIVRFTNAVAKQQGIYVGRFDADSIAALVKQGTALLGLDEEKLGQLTSGLRDKVVGRLKA